MGETTSAIRTGPTAVAGRSSSASWERLLVLAGAAECIAMLAVAAVLGDVEAAVIGAGFAVGLGLLRVRSGLLGRILLALGAANVLVWMSLAAFSILAGGDGVGALFIPALLTALSLSTLVAAVGTTVTRRRTSAPTSGPVFVAAAAAGLFTFLLVAGAVGSGGAGRVEQPGDLSLSTANLTFTETELVADAGQVGVVVDNQDLFWHTFTIDELGVDLPVSVNGERRVTFDADPGAYEYYCRVPGHETLMRGTLTVR